MFSLRNKKIRFLLHTLNLSPVLSISREGSGQTVSSEPSLLAYMGEVPISRAGSYSFIHK